MSSNGPMRKPPTSRITRSTSAKPAMPSWTRCDASRVKPRPTWLTRKPGASVRRTEDWVCEALMAIGRRMTREPVRLTDAAGFLVNQVGRGFTLEASRLVYEGVAGFPDVDRVMRDVGGFRMGPFELMELTGLDVTQPASELIYNQFFHEPRYRPNLIMQARYEAGVLGRKTKRGFYNYDAEMKAIVSPETPAPKVRPGSVWVSAAAPYGRPELTALLNKIGAPLESGAKPSSKALCL